MTSLWNLLTPWRSQREPEQPLLPEWHGGQYTQLPECIDEILEGSESLFRSVRDIIGEQYESRASEVMEREGTLLYVSAPDFTLDTLRDLTEVQPTDEAEPCYMTVAEAEQDRWNRARLGSSQAQRYLVLDIERERVVDIVDEQNRSWIFVREESVQGYRDYFFGVHLDRMVEAYASFMDEHWHVSEQRSEAARRELADVFENRRGKYIITTNERHGNERIGPWMYGRVSALDDTSANAFLTRDAAEKMLEKVRTDDFITGERGYNLDPDLIHIRKIDSEFIEGLRENTLYAD